MDRFILVWGSREMASAAGGAAIDSVGQGILREFMTMLIPGWSEERASAGSVAIETAQRNPADKAAVDLANLAAQDSTCLPYNALLALLTVVLPQMSLSEALSPELKLTCALIRKGLARLAINPANSSSSVNSYIITNTKTRAFYTNKTTYLGKGKCGIVRESTTAPFVYKQIIPDATYPPDYMLIDTLKEVFISFLAYRMTEGKTPNIVGVYTDEAGVLYIKMNKISGQSLEDFIITNGLYSTRDRILSIIDQAKNIFKSLHKSPNLWIIHGDAHHGNFYYDSATGTLYVFDWGLSKANFYGYKITNSSSMPPTNSTGYVLDTSFAMFLTCFADTDENASKLGEYKYTLEPDIRNKILSYFSVIIEKTYAFNLFRHIKLPWCSIKYRHPFHIFYWSTRFMAKWISGSSGTGDFAPINTGFNNALSTSIINGITSMGLFYPSMWDVPFAEYEAKASSSDTRFLTPSYTVLYLKPRVLVLSYVPRILTQFVVAVAGAAGAAIGAAADVCGRRQQEAIHSEYTSYSVDVDTFDTMPSVLTRGKAQKVKSELDTIIEEGLSEPEKAAVKAEDPAEEALKRAAEVGAAAAKSAALKAEQESAARAIKSAKATRAGRVASPKPSQIKMPLSIVQSGKTYALPPKSKPVFPINNAAIRRTLKVTPAQVKQSIISKSRGGRRTLRKKLKSKQTRKKYRHSYK